MITVIRLTGGRGIVRGEIIHMNPNYVVIIDQSGTERYVPQHIIATMKRSA